MAAPTPIRKRLNDLRREMARRGVDALLVPSADAFQGEYVPTDQRRLAWISGFTGSMGTAVVTARQACLFVDGRYTLQASLESPFKTVPLAKSSPAAWLEANLKPGQVLGVDPWLVTMEGVAKYEQAIARAKAGLRLLDANPLDTVWENRPRPAQSHVFARPLAHAGESAAAKRKRIAAALKKQGADAWLIARPESLCWLLNLRAQDVPNTPLLLAYGLLHADASVDLFVDAKRLTAPLDKAVRVRQPEQMFEALKRLGKTRKKVLVDPSSTPLFLGNALIFSGATLLKGGDPVELAMACKNRAEITGARNAHKRDGRALVRFLAGLKPGISECSAAAQVDRERAKEKLTQGPSFGTIAAFGPNGAIVHYRARPGQDAKLKAGGLFLLDSGGQYLDGTTDVTRTVLIGRGKPGLEEKRLFTLVLKGHIALATAVFPKGTTGGQLDALARQFLWREGLDYDHGTGHGVGSFLSVHEGPARISKAGGTAPLAEGMVLSIEPGYYRQGHFGIRIESLGLVAKAKRRKGHERELLCFEILTLVPIDRKLIAPGLLSKSERDWLNAYHQRVRSALSRGMDAKTSAWLARATAPI